MELMFKDDNRPLSPIRVFAKFSKRYYESFLTSLDIRGYWKETLAWNVLKGNSETAEKLKFSIKGFFSKRDQSAVSCGFGHIYWKNRWWKVNFLCSVSWLTLFWLTLDYEITLKVVQLTFCCCSDTWKQYEELFLPMLVCIHQKQQFPAVLLFWRILQNSQENTCCSVL